MHPVISSARRLGLGAAVLIAAGVVGTAPAAEHGRPLVYRSAAGNPTTRSDMSWATMVNQISGGASNVTHVLELTSTMNADVAASEAVLTPTEILKASTLVRPEDVPKLGANLSKYSITRLTLEAEDGRPAISPAVVLEGPFFTP